MEKDFPLSLLKEKTFAPIELAPKGLDSLSRDVVSPAPNANGVELTQ
jgi:hypothetical protein